MSRADNIAKHRLGVARKALKKIQDYIPDWRESDSDARFHLKSLAEYALKDMEKIK